MDQLLPASGILPIDPDSFKHLYGEYQNFVYRRAYSMLGDSAAAEDVTQNTFIQVYRNLHSFRGGEFRVWLYRIVTNACYDELRRRQRHARLRPISIDAYSSDTDPSDRLVSQDMTAEEYLEQVELSDAIQRCLNIMPSLPTRAPGAGGCAGYGLRTGCCPPGDPGRYPEEPPMASPRPSAHLTPIQHRTDRWLLCALPEVRGMKWDGGWLIVSP